MKCLGSWLIPPFSWNSPIPRNTPQRPQTIKKTQPAGRLGPCHVVTPSTQAVGHPRCIFLFDNKSHLAVNSCPSLVLSVLCLFPGSCRPYRHRGDAAGVCWSQPITAHVPFASLCRVFYVGSLNLLRRMWVFKPQKSANKAFSLPLKTNCKTI